jgi:mono/diheme cytochrome c family protein
MKLRATAAGMTAVALLFTAGYAFAQTQPDSQVTFTKDIAPLLQRSCQTCHRPGAMGPMSLLTYEEARPWARSIRQQVSQRNMPPWYIDKSVGVRNFRDDPSLSDAEVATIAKWVDSGAPMGDPALMPAPKSFDDSDRWHIGTPDKILMLTKEVVVKAKAPDYWADLEMSDLGLKTDRYIKAVEVKPLKGAKVVHHAVAQTRYEDEQGNLEQGLLEEYAVGKFGDIFPDGTGRLMKAGTQPYMNVHLHAIGADTPVQIAVGIKFYPEGYKPPHQEIVAHVGDNEDLDIPPNSKNVRADGYTVLTKPARLTAFQPHLHNRGQAQCLELIYPPAQSGARAPSETVSCVDRYHFNWHIVYHYAEEAQPIVPAGTILHVTSWFDNTAGNKNNPDPGNPIAFGQRTVDDMSFAWLSWYYISDDEYRQMLTERMKKPGKFTAANYQK